MLWEALGTGDENPSSCPHRSYSNQEYHDNKALLNAENPTKCKHMPLVLCWFMNISIKYYSN